MNPASEKTTTQLRIGRYLILGRIGKGGMGMVYRGYDEVLEREVAIKTLIAEGTADRESRKRFEVEAKAVAKMQHPNIVTVFELGEDRGIPFIAMELLGGTDLETLMRSREELVLEEKLEILTQVCHGLAYAHERGIVHRDVKPSNIRLLDDGGVKIMDFGVAKFGGMNLTKSGMMVGTLHYMSPEQIRGLTLDGRSDVFSLGVILHELLAGQRPFTGDTTTGVLLKILNDDAPRLPGEWASGCLQEVADKALAKNRDERFAGAMAFAEALQGMLGSRPRASPSAADLEDFRAAKKLLQQGKLAEATGRLEPLVTRSPGLLEARRDLRTARRPPADLSSAQEGFPELAGTFEAAPTQRPDETLLKETVALPKKSPVSFVRWAVGGVAVLLGAFLWSRLAPRSEHFRVRSNPPGASVLLAGQDTGLVTNAELAIPASKELNLQFRKTGYEEVLRVVKPPFPVEVVVDLVPLVVPGGDVNFDITSDPPGASVMLDGQSLPGLTPVTVAANPSKEHRLSFRREGYEAQDLSFAAGTMPRNIRVPLSSPVAPGSLTVVSSFPVEVVWHGRVLAQGRTPRATLAAGKQAVTLVSAAYFLRKNVVVEVQSGANVSIEAPSTGRISVRANPDNCKVLIDGSFVDYPPILDKAISEGGHTVTFQWSDGTQREEAVQVEKGKPAYVTGRRN